MVCLMHLCSVIILAPIYHVNHLIYPGLPFFCVQGTDGYLTAGEELLIESARLVAKAGATLGNPGGA